jgi:hypothetical protein
MQTPLCSNLQRSAIVLLYHELVWCIFIFVGASLIRDIVPFFIDHTIIRICRYENHDMQMLPFFRGGESRVATDWEQPNEPSRVQLVPSSQISAPFFSSVFIRYVRISGFSLYIRGLSTHLSPNLTKTSLLSCGG